MKRALFLTGLILLLVLLGTITLSTAKKKLKSDLDKPLVLTEQKPTPTKTKGRPLEKRSAASLFIPYWTLGGELDASGYDELIYFGITPTTSGIDTSDEGYQKLGTFVKNAPEEKKKSLTLRMLDSEENFDIIESSKTRKKVITDSIILAKQYAFDGIVLDLEVAAIPFESVIQNINTFVKEFNSAAKKEKMEFTVTIYGDAAYRIRPFDLKVIGENSDRVMIMAYDFSKSRSNPGPNFPLKGSEKYGYDYEKLVEDFTLSINPEKISVIFGFFGYDWEVDEKDKSLSQGESKSLSQIKKEVVDNCIFVKCEWKRDRDSMEIMARYEDKDGKNHIIWFEDETSANAKEEFLRQNGIANISHWAYTYF